MFHRPLTRRPSRRAAVAVGVVAIVGAALAAGPALSAAAAVRPADSTPAAGSSYLALGDSIAFGYQEANTNPPPNYLDASSLVGYPEDLASDLNLQVANAACPGETTSSYLNVTKPSNGCESSPGGGAGYRQGYLLHESYNGSQAAYAQNFLKAHPSTGLVTLGIGANDGFLCQETTPDMCQSELGAVLKKMGTNVKTILKQIRTQAGYTGPIVIVNYYSLDYNNQTDNYDSIAVNTTVDKAAAKYNVIVADGYGAFQTASSGSGGDPCAAGLLTQLSGGGCGIHPTAAGQEVLTQAVETALSNN